MCCAASWAAPSAKWVEPCAGQLPAPALPLPCHLPGPLTTPRHPPALPLAQAGRPFHRSTTNAGAPAGAGEGGLGGGAGAATGSMSCEWAVCLLVCAAGGGALRCCAACPAGACRVARSWRPAKHSLLLQVPTQQHHNTHTPHSSTLSSTLSLILCRRGLCVLYPQRGGQDHRRLARLLVPVSPPPLLRLRGFVGLFSSFEKKNNGEVAAVPRHP